MKSPSEYATAARQWLGIERFKTADGVEVWAGQQVAFQVHGCLAFGKVESWEPWLDRQVVILRDVYVFGNHPNGVKATVFNSEVYRFWVRRF